jgi:hypothetical protein
MERVPSCDGVPLFGVPIQPPRLQISLNSRVSVTTDHNYPADSINRFRPGCTRYRDSGSNVTAVVSCFDQGRIFADDWSRRLADSRSQQSCRGEPVFVQ